MIAFVGIAVTTILLALQPGRFYFYVSSSFSFCWPFFLALAFTPTHNILARQIPDFNPSNLPSSCQGCSDITTTFSVSLTILLSPDSPCSSFRTLAVPTPLHAYVPLRWPIVSRSACRVLLPLPILLIMVLYSISLLLMRFSTVCISILIESL